MKSGYKVSSQFPFMSEPHTFTPSLDPVRHPMNWRRFEIKRAMRAALNARLKAENAALKAENDALNEKLKAVNAALNEKRKAVNALKAENDAFDAVYKTQQHDS